jgi:hypothetical protein
LKEVASTKDNVTTSCCRRRPVDPVKLWEANAAFRVLEPFVGIVPEIYDLSRNAST